MAQRQNRRGFAAMDEEEVREIARRGGQASRGGQGGEQDEEEEGDEGEGQERGAAGSTEAAARGGRNSRGGQGGGGGGGQQGSRRVISRAIRVLNEIESRIEELKEELEEQAGGGSSGQRSSGGNGRGFAGMDPEEQRRIASKGGRAAHEKGSAHEWDSEEAREAGRRGSQNSGGNRG